MNVLIITPDQYRGDIVHFTDRVFNTSNESAFSRIIQCDECVMITGISVLLLLSNVDSGEINCRGVCRNFANYSKKNAHNLEITRNVQYIEQDILKQYGRTFDVLDKPMCLNVSESLMRGRIKISNCDRDEYDYDRDHGDNECDNDEFYSDSNVSDKLDEFHSNHRRITNIVLKISGIWETESEYGLTYKYYC